MFAIFNTFWQVFLKCVSYGAPKVPPGDHFHFLSYFVIVIIHPTHQKISCAHNIITRVHMIITWLRFSKSELQKVERESINLRALKHLSLILLECTEPIKHKGISCTYSI